MPQYPVKAKHLVPGFHQGPWGLSSHPGPHQPCTGSSLAQLPGSCHRPQASGGSQNLGHLGLREMARGGGCTGVGGCLPNGSCRLSSFDHPFAQEGRSRNVRGLLHSVFLSLQGPPGQPGYPGAMGPPGLPVSKGTVALGYGSLRVVVRTGPDLSTPLWSPSFPSIFSLCVCQAIHTQPPL